MIRTSRWMQRVYESSSTGPNSRNGRFHFFQWAKSKGYIRHRPSYDFRLSKSVDEWWIDDKLADICDIWLQNRGYGGLSFAEFIEKMGYGR